VLQPPPDHRNRIEDKPAIKPAHTFYIAPLCKLRFGKPGVQFCTVLTRIIGNTLTMDMENAGLMPSVIQELDIALAELRSQGLTVRLHSGPNNTWHIADGGLYSGYVASGAELLELRSANKLNMRGIKDLG
jgi:hypothetical protein